jgi:membrane protease YdiL (CAAX protease family)
VAPAWYAAVLLGPALLNLLGRAVAGAVGAAPGPLPATDRVLAAFATSFAGYLLLNTEELAWRGYAWPRLRDRLGALRGSVLLGVLWGVLHAPLFLMRGGHPGGWPPALFIAMTVAWSVLFALVYEGTGGSVLVAHLLHQALNAWGDAIPTYPRVAGGATPAVLVTLLAAGLAVAGARRAGWRWDGGPPRAAGVARAVA